MKEVTVENEVFFYFGEGGGTRRIRRTTTAKRKGNEKENLKTGGKG